MPKYVKMFGNLDMQVLCQKSLKIVCDNQAPVAFLQKICQLFYFDPPCLAPFLKRTHAQKKHPLAQNLPFANIMPK
jgi:hypothetical protein